MLDTSRLRAQLQDRRNRVLRAHPQTVETELGSLLRFIEERPLLAGALESLRDECPGFEVDGWIEAHFQQNQIKIPDEEPCRARLYEGILRAAVDDEQYIVSITRHLSNGQVPERVETFNQHFVEPFVRLIDDRLEEGDFLLALLARYRHEVSWFRRAELHAAAGQSGQSEKVLDTDLRRSLFEMGVDYPFSQPRSPSGEPDIVVGAEDPKPIEVKLFDPDRDYGVNRVRQGVRQAYDYAGDFGHGVGYLVIFNYAEHPLELPSDDANAAWPPRLVVGNRTVYLITVDLNPPQEPSSRRRAVTPIVLMRDELLPNDGLSTR